jgi:hypothetical protein
VIGETVKVLGSRTGKGSRRASSRPVFRSRRTMVPPAPGTYTEPLASTAWKTGSQNVSALPGAFQSLR